MKILKNGYFKGVGVLLIIVSLMWAFFILVLYSDSMMSDSHTMLNSIICLLLLGIGLFLIIGSQKR
ncbi:hypothetical protein [Mucilaginibacter sp. OK098]|uniref:hypothetical protein n=1 Tax=Mucilaginibacter sp. OK098 TaxID=1855297 RepID=UPI0011610C64|nr:hypothetical protein [Mucilaginibacter sp. OK098]